MSPDERVSPAAPLIEARDLAIGYRRRPIASGITLAIQPGDRWGILGPNGAGKTTLVRTLMGTMRPLGGTIRFGRPLRFGYVKQRDTLHERYPFTVTEVVETGRYRSGTLFFRLRGADRDAVEQALVRTGIEHLRDRPVRELSGGQKQRVLLARALCAEPDVIVMDEPTNDMDIAGEEAVLGLVRDVQAQTGAAVILISHLLQAVLRTAEQIIFVNRAETTVFTRQAFIEDNHLERFYGMPIRIKAHPDGTYSVTAQQATNTSGEAGHVA